MSNKCDWLKTFPSETCPDSIVYSIDEISTSFEIIPLKSDGWLVLNKINWYWLKFAVLVFSRSNTDGTNKFGSMVFHGEGTTGLRECRHTYWGDDGDGYVFFPNGILISDAFEKLSEYFDLMAEKEEDCK